MPEIGPLAADRALGHDVLPESNLRFLPYPLQGRQAIKTAGRSRPWRSARAWAGALLFAALACAAAPHLLARAEQGPPASGSDAIFVLTGDEHRIAEGFRAWRDGRGRQLFILGAGRDARLELVLRGFPPLSPVDRERVHLERWSRNTFENAFSAKAFVVTDGYRSVILVTSDYHVPRALRAFRNVLPADVAVSVLPVRSSWEWGPALARTVRRFLLEGWKYWWYRLFLLWQ